MSVKVYGTQRNIDEIKAEDIIISIDLANLTTGQQHAPLIVTGKNNIVTYEIADGRTYVEVEIEGVE
jgi:YbbR domain-containing protein